MILAIWITHTSASTRKVGANRPRIGIVLSVQVKGWWKPPVETLVRCVHSEQFLERVQQELQQRMVVVPLGPPAPANHLIGARPGPAPPPLSPPIPQAVDTGIANEQAFRPLAAEPDSFSAPEEAHILREIAQETDNSWASIEIWGQRTSKHCPPPC